MAQGQLKLSREQLAAFLKDHQSIKQFEKLFSTVDEIAPDFVNEVSFAAGMAQANANEALAQLTRLANAVELLANAPATQNNNSLVTDYIDFDGTPPHSDKARRIVWNNSDDTLNIHHTGGVTQQVGLEEYVRFTNNTASTIDDATVVGFDYVGGVTNDDIVPFIADGSVPLFNIVGITTQSIAAGAAGRATVFGMVRNIDTTGTPYGETWATGDLLYASDTDIGGMTNAPPTAPSWRIPVAINTYAHATLGTIFVRPTIDQPLYYGEFVKTSDTSPAVINTAYALTFNGTNIANGISIGATTSQIIADFPGLYKFIASIELVSGSASVKNVWFWFRKNGTDIADTATLISLDSATAIQSPSISVLISLDAADYVEMVWASDSTNVTVKTTASTAFAPRAPGVKLIVTQDQQ